MSKSSSVSDIELELQTLEKISNSGSGSKKTIIYSVLASVLSLFVFRPLYVYKRDDKPAKGKKISNELRLCYLRTAGCFVSYTALFYLFFRFYMRI